MKDLPTIKGRRINSAPSFPERRYVYNGSDRFVPPTPRDPDAPQCGADDCYALPHAKGYCDLHYRRLMAYGTPYAPDRRRKENRNAARSA